MAKNTKLIISLNKAFTEKSKACRKKGCVWVCPFEFIVKPKTQRRSA